MCKDKHYGGLGLRDIEKFNIALLRKWLWRMCAEKDSLWIQVLKSKYSVCRMDGVEDVGIRWGRENGVLG